MGFSIEDVPSQTFKLVFLSSPCMFFSCLRYTASFIGSSMHGLEALGVLFFQALVDGATLVHVQEALIGLNELFFKNK